ncbi:hypothetical protein DYH09_09600 [bacterium CPR1]|nr:hypothetical protein [bacterium CPR1]
MELPRSEGAFSDLTKRGSHSLKPNEAHQEVPMKRFWLGLLIVALLAVVPALPARGEGGKVLLFPVLIQGEYKPRSEKEFTQALINQARKIAPKANIIVAREADLGGLHYAGGTQPPSVEEAGRLCAAYDAKFAVWLSLRFTPELVSGADSVLSIAGAARMWGYQAEDRKVIVDEPISVVRSTPAGSYPNDQQLVPLADKLSSQCINQLAQQVVTLGRQSANQEMVQQWARPAAQPQAPKVNAKMKRMVDSLERYRRAVDSGDLIGSTDTQRVALSAWRDLSPQEQKQIEQMYPGTWQWMEGGFYYDTGNYWYPGYGGGRVGGGRR